MSYLIGISAVPLLQTNKIKLRTGASIYIHAWKSCQNHCVMVGSFVGKRISVVPVWEGLRIPSTSQAKEHGRYGLLFFRHWTLVPDASFNSIAHFGDLDLTKVSYFLWISFCLTGTNNTFRDKDIWDFSENPNYYLKTSLVPNLCNYKLLLSACQAPVLPKQQAFPITKL